MCVALSCVGCGAAHDGGHVGATWLESYDIGMSEAPTNVEHLRWHALYGDCLQVYRITVTYDHNPPREANSESWITVGPHPRRPEDAAAARRPIAPGTTYAGRLFYDGISVGSAGAARDMHLSPTAVGPSAPTSACYPRTWDPMDDALALGWPQLTGRLTAVGEHWRGARVEGRCNRTACIDPETYAMGEEAHDRACVTRDWDEELVGVLEVGDERIAAIRSTWDDGHPLVSAQRRALVYLPHGRPVWAEAVIDHRPPQLGDDNTWAPIKRTWRMESIDSCPGSLASLGWDRGPELEAAHAAAVERFGLEEDERRGRARRERRRKRAAEGANARQAGDTPAPTDAPSPAPAATAGNDSGT